jgi:isopentenyl-diphosphate delta-isomerase
MDLRRFEDRKADHLRLALDPANSAESANLFDRLKLQHDALPELNFAEIETKQKFWDYTASTPCFISSMTAGHVGGEGINLRLAKVAAAKGWPMGVGSQRRELSDPAASKEWKDLRAAAPKAFLFSNLGLAQLIINKTDAAIRLIENLQAGAIFVHLNPLQECLQPEGTTNFKGGLSAIEALVKRSPVPVIIKETGCGISAKTARQLVDAGVSAIDVSGLGGTHWGRIEGARAKEHNFTRHALAAQTFADWGISTLDSILAVAGVVSGSTKTEVWASGGVRNGLDAAKCLSLGANKIGFAKVALQAALIDEETLATWMDQIEFELKIACFNTGSQSLEELKGKYQWQKI